MLQTSRERERREREKREREKRERERKREMTMNERTACRSLQINATNAPYVDMTARKDSKLGVSKVFY
jgi:hypothetical protein